MYRQNTQYFILHLKARALVTKNYKNTIQEQRFLNCFSEVTLCTAASVPEWFEHLFLSQNPSLYTYIVANLDLTAYHDTLQNPQNVTH